MNGHDPLTQFLPPVAHWFRTALGQPTPAQAQAWPLIAAGQHTLILAPTGSGKTLAAFLVCLDGLWRQLDLARGVRVLYVSPLKALNNDIYRFAGAAGKVQAAARDLGLSLPAIEVAVRTETRPPPSAAACFAPPHVLITTPESLHLP
jgi:ATP-dependent Lhr-like helicase